MFIADFLARHSIYVAIAALLCIIYLIYVIYTLKTYSLELSTKADALDTLNTDLLQRLQMLDKEHKEQSLVLKDTEHMAIVLRQDNKNLDLKIKELTQSMHSKDLELKSFIARHNEQIKKIASLEGQVDALELLAEENDRRYKIQSLELESRLKALSEEIVQKRSDDLQKQSLNSFGKAVQPLKEELYVFRDLITKVQKINSEQSGALKQELDRLNEAQLNLKLKADDLVKALKSGGKSQGMWGEHQLELVLENSGLRKGFEYKREVAGRSDLNERGRADVIVNLPENKCIIIDAKCSLTAYTDFVNAQDNALAQKALQAHTNSIKAHIDELASARYDEYSSFNSPSFIFMFVPVDGALSCALEYKSDLYAYAASKNIYLVSPQTLLPALRVVSNLWVLATQNDRVKDIVKNAMAIYKKSLLVKEAFDESGRKLEQLHSSFAQAQNRLSLGRGSLCSLLESFSRQAPAISDGSIIDIDDKDKEDKIDLS